ncbi:glycoside hydrolase domain-containing protein [Aeromicrobium sp. UC242_57]|uniref:glycoside hydrolase domain-containing protein n=1 Tax=Aeromicrobium sp. UC242_57 TaxID=3374624 RepID=UPI0037C12F47
MLTSPATAATPKAPGNFTGHGFDACVAPSQSVMDTWNLQSPFSAIGIYISGNSRYCGDKYQPHLSKSWVSKNAANGWRFIPIHVGRQSPCFKNNPNSRVQKKHMSTNVTTARRQARSEARETIAALKKYGFGAGSVSYLDIEWYARTSKCDRIVLEFADAWTEYLHAKGYKSGLYSSGSAAIKLVDEARAAKRKGFTLPDHMWIAWVNKVADTDGGPYLSDAGWTNHQRIHQYHNGVDVTYGKKTVNIDKNYLDVGKGSVAAKQTLRCGVKMTFTSYPQLQLGSQGPEVAALECLLRGQGLLKAVDTTFGKGTERALDAYRASKGWPATGRTTPATWTALLAHGGTPRVLKEGSVGQSVWRLQRALIAAGLRPRMSGVYDDKTVKAVKAYRKARKLPAYPTTESKMWAAEARQDRLSHGSRLGAPRRRRPHQVGPEHPRGIRGCDRAGL